MTNTRFHRWPSRLPVQPFRPALKDPLPDTKDFGELSEAVETAFGHRDYHLAAHDLPLQVGVGIPVTLFRTGALAGAVVLVLIDRCVWSQFFEPHLVVMMQSAFVVVDKYAGGNVERIYKGQSPLYHIPHSYH